MRTTLTLEPDVVARLKDLAHRKRIPFKVAVDMVLRRGLAAQEGSGQAGTSFRVLTFRSGLKPGIDPARINQLVDELEAREVLSR